jgi:tetratricopeptide (TPR) repeat protein
MKLLITLKKYLIFSGAILFVVFILPGFPSAYYVPKEIFLSIVVCLALIATLVNSILKGEAKFASGKFDVGVILLTISYILASILKTPNKMEAFFFPGTTTFVILSALFYLIVNQFTKRGKNAVLLSLFASGILLSLSILFTKLGIFAKIPQLPSFMKDATFNPSGANLQSIAYLLTIIPIGLIQIIKDKDLIKKVFFGVSSAIIIFGVVLAGADMLPGKSQTPVFPSWRTSWAVVVESLKESPVLGVGPGNYLSAFNLFRPLSYNQTDLWQVRFTSANNYYFTLITEVGLLGAVAFVMILIGLYKKISFAYKNKAWEEISIAILILSLAFIPISPVLIFLLMALLAIFSSSEEKSFNIASNKVPVAIVASPIFLAIAVLAFFGTKAVKAEAVYQKSLEALVANDAQKTYDYMVRAEKLNPYVDRYRASLAQIEMALANSIASKKELTDADRTTITQLLQQAISEGKATVSLNTGRSGNWEVLAQIYRSIMSFADGANDYAISTYTQAVALDPINPNLRISLGGVYYSLGDYDNAISAFQLATVAKSDLANAHYNLAAAYAGDKNYDKAINSMNIVISLVDPNSEDYKTAQTVLEQMKKQKPATTESVSESLTTPQPIEETKIEPPITLPEEATPPAQSE